MPVQKEPEVRATNAAALLARHGLTPLTGTGLQALKKRDAEAGKRVAERAAGVACIKAHLFLKECIKTAPEGLTMADGETVRQTPPTHCYVAATAMGDVAARGGEEPFANVAKYWIDKRTGKQPTMAVMRSACALMFISPQVLGRKVYDVVIGAMQYACGPGGQFGGVVKCINRETHRYGSGTDPDKPSIVSIILLCDPGIILKGEEEEEEEGQQSGQPADTNSTDEEGEEGEQEETVPDTPPDPIQ